MKKAITAVALALASLAVAPPVTAQDLFRAVSSGPGESPPNGSPGSSVATFEVDGP